jgi:hypothetical protein
MPIEAVFTPSNDRTTVQLRLKAGTFPAGFNAFDLNIKFNPAKAVLSPPTPANFAGSIRVVNTDNITNGVLLVSSINPEGPPLPAQTPLATLEFSGILPTGFSVQVTRLNVGEIPYLTTANAITFNSDGTSSQVGVTPPPPPGGDGGGGGTTPPPPRPTDPKPPDPDRPVAVAESDRLPYAELLQYLPGLRPTDPLEQFTLKGNPFFVRSLPNGETAVKLIGRATAGIEANLEQDVLTLSVKLPANLSFSASGPASMLTPQAARSYFHALVDKNIPATDPNSAALKASISALSQSPGANIGPAKLITLERQGVAAGPVTAEFTGRPGANEMLAVNLWPTNAEIRVSHISHVLAIGPGQVTAVGFGDVSLVGDRSSQVLRGGPGNDYLYAGGGEDILHGGGGNNVFHIAQAGHVTIADPTVNDRLRFSIFGVKNLSDLAIQVTRVEPLANGTRFHFGSELSVTLIGVPADFPFTESNFLFS